MADSSGLRAAVVLDARDKAQLALEDLARQTRDATPTGLTGLLGDSERTDGPDINGEVITAAIEAPAPYASFVDSGTKPYTIRPKKGNLLVFESGGETVFARVVHHPGITARKFFSVPMAERWTRALAAVFG